MPPAGCQRLETRGSSTVKARRSKSKRHKPLFSSTTMPFCFLSAIRCSCSMYLSALCLCLRVTRDEECPPSTCSSAISSSSTSSPSSSSDARTEANTSIVLSEEALNLGTSPFAPRRNAVSFSAKRQKQSAKNTILHATKQALTLFILVVYRKVDCRQYYSCHGGLVVGGKGKTFFV
jgi:hypothetical protein